jgi:tetratricopeptide (TPR) repeat protein
VTVAVLSGTPGVGKTALAIHWAHRAAGHFPDGQLYANLRGFDPGGRPTPPAEAVRGFLDALGVPPGAVPAGLDSQVGLYRSRVAGKRMLIVLDNARDTDQIRPLLPGTPSVVVVVTSRDRLTGLVAGVGAEPVMLDPLSTPESRDLLARRLGRDQLAGDPDAVRRIIAACARLPLALTIAAARARQSGFALHEVADELNEAGQRLDVLDTADRSSQVRAVFSWSYASLAPAAARLFRLLGLHPGAEVSVTAAASLAGHPPTAIRPLLLELVRANLLAEQAPGRYTRHDLLGVYAAERCRAEDSDAERAAAVRRMLDHYTHSAYRADRIVYPLRDPIPIPLDPPAAGVTPEEPAGEDRAMAWFEAEHAVLLADLRRAADEGFDVPVLQLAWALRTFHVYGGHRGAMATVWRAAILAAQRIGRLDLAAEAHRCVALAATYVDDHDEAHAHYQQALRLFAEAGDDVGQGYTHQSLALLSERRDDPRGALHHAERAVAMFRSGGHDRARAKALNAVGWYHAMLGEHAQALVHCEQALALLERFDDPYGQAHTWDSLGYIHASAGHAERAVECYRRALALFDELGNRGDSAPTLVRLGDCHEAAGDRDAARAAWRQALDIFTALGHPEAASVEAKLRSASGRSRATPA